MQSTNKTHYSLLLFPLLFIISCEPLDKQAAEGSLYSWRRRTPVSSRIPVASATPVASPLPVPSPLSGYHVTPSGNGSGDGSLVHPWDLKSALQGAPNAAGKMRIQPGDTVWLHAGLYQSAPYRSTVSGSASLPITFRQAPGEKSRIDLFTPSSGQCDNITVDGNYTTFWGFEVFCSFTRRTTPTSGSWPEDMNRGSITNNGSDNKFVNLVLHDLGTALCMWATGEGGESYGNLIYHNGWSAPDRGHGHGIYTQNLNGRKKITDTILFGQFGNGMQIYGSESASLKHYDVDGNMGFMNGFYAGVNYYAFYVGGGSPVEDIVFTGNHTWGVASNGGSPVRIGQADSKSIIVKNNYLGGYIDFGQFANAEFTGNILVGGLMIRFLLGSPFSGSGYTWNNNKYYVSGGGSQFQISDSTGNTNLDFAGWKQKTDWDSQSVFSQSVAPNKITVRPNQYEPGRANIYVYNWQKNSSVNVDISSVGLVSGKHYKLMDAQDFYGTPVLSGIYDGTALTVPMTTRKYPQPIGQETVTGFATGPEFGVFILIPE